MRTRQITQWDRHACGSFARFFRLLRDRQDRADKNDSSRKPFGRQKTMGKFRQREGLIDG